MCEYFSCIVTKDGKVLWTEEEGHETVIQRSGLKDVSLIDMEFVRIEVTDGNIENYKVDELDTLPAWYEKRENEFVEKITALLEQINPLKQKRAALCKGFETKWDAIANEYWTKKNTINKEYETKRVALYKEYQTKRDAIYKEYQTKRDALYRGIEGYVSKVI